jgi:hypothetical protein
MPAVDAIGTVVHSDTLHGRTSVCAQNCNENNTAFILCTLISGILLTLFGIYPQNKVLFMAIYYSSKYIK